MAPDTTPGPELNTDARRYAWCWSQAVWSFGVVLPMLAEDVEGAEESGQAALLSYVARLVAEYCATAVYLVETFPRPLPPTSVRAIVAMRAVRDPLLRDLLEELIRDRGCAAGTVADSCRRAIARTSEIIGPLPQLIDREERHRVFGHARDWLRFVSEIGEGEGDYLPSAGPNPVSNSRPDQDGATSSGNRSKGMA